MKYRKKPVVIEAYQTDKEMDIETLEGTMHASVGDYIITGVRGEQYPCKPDIFEQTYEPADAPTASPWHRVEEELPNFSGKVLVNIKPVVSCDSDRFETAYYNCLMSGDIDPKTFWQYDYEKDCIVDITKYVTHWMAVEPPKEEE